MVLTRFKRATHRQLEQVVSESSSHGTNLVTLNTQMKTAAPGRFDAGQIVYSRGAWRNVTDDFEVWDNTTDANNSSFTVTSDGFLRSDVAVDSWNNNIMTKFKTSDAEVEVSMEFKIDATPTSTSYGIAVGIVSANTWYGPSMLAYLDCSTSPDAGVLKLYHSTGTGVSGLNAIINSPDASIDTGITPAAGQIYTMKIVKSGQKMQAVLVYNGQEYTTEVFSDFVSVNTPPNTCRVSIHQQGGVHLVRSLTVRSMQAISPHILTIGDSKTQGSNAGSFAATYPRILSNLTGAVVSNYGGSGDRTIEVLAHTPHLVKYLRAQYVVICVGRNDLASNVATSTWESNYSAIVTLLKSRGFTVIHLLPIPEIVQDQTVLKSWIETTYPDDFKVDPSVGWSNASMLQNDNVHPNADGMIHIATKLEDFFNGQSIVF